MTLRIDGNKAVLDRSSKTGQDHLEGIQSKGMPLQLEGQGGRYARVDRSSKIRATLSEKGSGYEGPVVMESLDGVTRYRDCNVSLTATKPSMVAAATATYGQGPEQALTNVQTSTLIPRHLELARELVATVKPENNKYVIFHHGSVRWKGDLFTSENSVNTMCVGLVTDVLERARSPSVAKVKATTQWKHELHVNNYYEAISKEAGFSRISKLSDLQSGDIFVITCKDSCSAKEVDSEITNNVQGHITFVDSKPILKKPTPPLIDGTLQWLMPVIDSAPWPHGNEDTRWRPEGEPRVSGVGRGTFRIYTDMDGVPVGYTKGPTATKLHTVQDRPIVFGRPQPY